MQARLLVVLMALSFSGLATTALAQDEVGDSEGDDTAVVAGDAAATPASSADATSASTGPSGPSKPISVSLLLGYGISLESGANPWSLGFGLRGGYNLDKIYLGARFVYYIGASQGPSSVNLWELGVEGGYDFDVAKGVVIRPLLGLGLANITAKVNLAIAGGPGSYSASSGEFFFAPGAAVLYDVSDNIFIGVDARFQIILANKTAKGLVFLANGGMRF